MRHTTQQTQYAIENIKASSEAIECLPMVMPEIVKKTFRDVLTDFYLEKRLASQNQEPSAQILMNNNYPSNANQASRRVVRQIATTSTYIREIGIVTVQSISTTFRECESSIPRISTVTQTDLLLNPHPRVHAHGSMVFIYPARIHNFSASSQAQIKGLQRHRAKRRNCQSLHRWRSTQSSLALRNWPCFPF